MLGFRLAERSHLLPVAVIALATALMTAAGSAQDTTGNEYGLMVEGVGVEETFYACTACHSEMLIVQQGNTRDRWDKLLYWMVDEQGMAPLDESERDVILDYLATHYNTDRPNFPR